MNKFEIPGPRFIITLIAIIIGCTSIIAINIVALRSIAVILLIILAGLLAVLFVVPPDIGKEQRRRLLDFFDNLTSAFILTDLKGIVTRTNIPYSVRFKKMNIGEEIHSLFESKRTMEAIEGNINFVDFILHNTSVGKGWSGLVDVIDINGRKVTTTLITSAWKGARNEITHCLFQLSDSLDGATPRRRFEESQQKYQDIVDSSLDGIVIVQDGRLVFVNSSAVQIFGFEYANEMKLFSFYDLIAPQSRSFVLVDYSNRFIGEEILRNYEIKGLTKGGVVIDLELNAKLISWNGRPALHTSFRDITQRKSLEREQALWLWEQETLSAIDRQLVGMMDLDKVMNAIAQYAKSLTRADLTGIMLLKKEANEIHWSAVRGRLDDNISLSYPLSNTLRTIMLNSASRQIKQEREDGICANDVPFLFDEKIITALLFPFMRENIVEGQLVVGFRTSHTFSQREMRLLSSLSEKSSIAFSGARLYENLRQREYELEILAAQYVKAQEAERSRISRELHDGMGQILTAIKFNIEILEENPSFPKDELSRIEDLKQQLETAMQEARQISYNLMPSVLADFGLVPALQLLSDQYGRTNNIKVNYSTQGLEERLDPAVEVGLYRIGQEALNNISKHSGAKEVTIQLVKDGSTLRFIIEDDGNGFQPHIRLMKEKHGMGLLSMRERARSMKGEFNIDSRPGAGTTIIVEIPLS